MPDPKKFYSTAAVAEKYIATFTQTWSTGHTLYTPLDVLCGQAVLTASSREEAEALAAALLPAFEQGAREYARDQGEDEDGPDVRVTIKALVEVEAELPTLRATAAKAVQDARARKYANGECPDCGDDLPTAGDECPNCGHVFTEGERDG